MQNKQTGFTLIELLVVVLIIGILSAVALPQYTKAVEKSRLSEALTTIKALRDQMDLYVLENGFPSTQSGLQDKMTIDLTGGNWEDSATYVTKNFTYYFFCTSRLCYFEVSPNNTTRGNYTLFGSNEGSGWKNSCASQDTDWGRQLCKSISWAGVGIYRHPNITKNAPDFGVRGVFYIAKLLTSKSFSVRRRTKAPSKASVQLL